MERFRLLRALGSRAAPTWAALQPLADGRTQLVVVERAVRGQGATDSEIADCVRDAKRLATLEHPNVARVREVVIRSDDVLIVTEFVDGVRWAELTQAMPAPSLEIALRVLVDVLTGLAAVHNLRDAKRVPLKLVHGALTPQCVIVGADGVSRIVGTSRLRSAAAPRDGAETAYLAPELLLADDSADARADIYSLGVMLWEALSGRPLFADLQPTAIVTQLLSGRVPSARVPQGMSWADPLVGIAARALSPDPDKRFESASAMAAEVRRAIGGKLPTPTRAATVVRGAVGERIKARRAELERGDVRSSDVSRLEPPTASSHTTKGSAAAKENVAADGLAIEVDLEEGRVSSVPTPVPPSVSAAAPTQPPPEVAAVPGAASVHRLAPPPPLRAVSSQSRFSPPSPRTLLGMAPPLTPPPSRAPTPPSVPPPKPSSLLPLKPSSLPPPKPSSLPPPKPSSVPPPKPSWGLPPKAREAPVLFRAVAPPAPVATNDASSSMPESTAAASPPAVTSEDSTPFAPASVSLRVQSGLPIDAARRRKIAVLAGAAALALMAAISLAWWIGSRGHDPKKGTSPSAGPTVVAPAIPRASPPATTTTATATATSTPTATAIPTATTILTPNDVPPRAAEPPTRGWNGWPPVNAAPTGAAPPRPRATTRRKYDPEGI